MYDEALARRRGALSKEGFGILSEIDVRATMKQKAIGQMPETDHAKAG